MQGETTFFPLGIFVFLVSKRKIFFLGGIGGLDVIHWKGQASWAVRSKGVPGRLTVEFVNVGGSLTHWDMAMDSCAQFLLVAEHRLIPARVRSVGHQLRKADCHSVWAPACQDQISGGPGIIPCLAKGIASGRFIDLALAHSLCAGKEPDATCRFKMGLGGISWLPAPMHWLPPLLARSPFFSTCGVSDSSVGGRCRMPLRLPTHLACLLGGHSGQVFHLLLL